MTEAMILSFILKIDGKSNDHLIHQVYFSSEE